MGGDEAAARHALLVSGGAAQSSRSLSGLEAKGLMAVAEAITNEEITARLARKAAL